MEERSTPIPPMNAVILERNKERILNIFSGDSIRIFDEENSWGDIVDGLFGDLDVDQEWIRVFAIQATYGVIALDRKRFTPMDDDVSSVDSLPAAAPVMAPKQAVRKSVPPPEMSPVLNPAKKPFIQTESLLSPDDTIGYDFPSLTSTAPRTMRQTDVTLSESTSRRIIMKKCACDFDLGMSASCSCVSERGKFLVPGKILKSRQVKKSSESEFLVSWKSFSNGDQYPNAWVFVDILRQWKSGVLLDYLISRIQYV